MSAQSKSALRIVYTSRENSPTRSNLYIQHPVFQGILRRLHKKIELSPATVYHWLAGSVGFNIAGNYFHARNFYISYIYEANQLGKYRRIMETLIGSLAKTNITIVVLIYCQIYDRLQVEIWGSPTMFSLNNLKVTVNAAVYNCLIIKNICI